MGRQIPGITGVGRGMGRGNPFTELKRPPSDMKLMETLRAGIIN